LPWRSTRRFRIRTTRFVSILSEAVSRLRSARPD
jgi:hypothetical protein